MDKNYQPEILKATDSLGDLNLWERSFIAHLNANQEYLATQTHGNKRHFFSMLMDRELNAALDMDDTMTSEAIPIRDVDENVPSLLK